MRCWTRVALAVAGMTAMAGCGVQTGTQALQGASVAGIGGRVHGGQNPVANATIQLYGVGTAGDGSAATSLLTQTVMTDAGGNFNLSPGGTPLYSCNGISEVYLAATGGNPGGNGANANLAMMTALGPCSALTQGTFIFVNELTTVAGVYALAPYMTSITNVGSGTSDAAALASAFTLAGELVSTSTGTTPGSGVPSGYTVPTTTLNTLADIVAACVNSTGGVATDTSTNCGAMFSLTTPYGQTPPTDTIGSLVYLAVNPTLNTTSNTAALFGLVPANAPFQPTLAGAPPAFSPALTPPPSSVLLHVSPAAVDFGNVGVGTSSSAQTVTFENISLTNAVTNYGLNIVGSIASHLTGVNTCLGSTLAASTTSAASTCSQTLIFKPTATGAYSGYIYMLSDASSSPQYVSLSGTGVAPSGTPSATLTGTLPLLPGLTDNLYLTNTGSGTLHISGVSTLTPYYSVVSQCGSTLAAGSSCGILLTNQAPFYAASNYLTASIPGNLVSQAYDQVTVSDDDPAGNTVFPIRPSEPPTQMLWPSNVMFPPTVVGQSSTATIYVPINPILTIGGGPFTLTNNGCGSTNGVYCTYTVTFRPTVAGPQSTSIGYTFATFPGGTNAYIPVTGAGLASAPSSNGALTPANLSFSDFSAAQQATLYNYSLSAINIASIGVTSGFSETNDCGTVLQGQSICHVTVSSTQQVQGGYQGLLTVVDDTGTYTETLSSFVGPILAFGDAQVGTRTVFQDTLYYNSYPSLVSVASYSNQGFAANSCYSQDGCTSTLTFTPTSVGTESALFTPTYFGQEWDSTTPAYVLTGKGVGAGPDLTFDAATVGNIRMYNSGSTTLDLTGAGAFTMTGANAANFTIIKSVTPACGMLAPGVYCVVQLTNVLGYGVTQGTLTVTDGTSGAMFNKTVLGGGPANVSLATVNFPTTAVNSTSAAMAVTTQLTGAQFGSATITGDPADYTFTKSTCSVSENPCVLQVVFNPVRYNGGSSIAAQVVVTPALRTLPTESAQMYGYASGLGFGTVSPTTVSYATRLAESTSIPVTVTLSNTGTVPLTLTAPALSGGNAGDFAIESTNCTTSLAAGSSCTVGVSFAPGTTGYKSSALVFSGETDTNLPVSVTLAGTAD
jgi:hypothetical protein